MNHRDPRQHAVAAAAFVTAATILTACVMPGDTSIAKPANETEQVAAAAYSVGDYAEAARLYERASAAAPRSVTALTGLGKSYSELGQLNRAQNALQAAEALRPRDPDVQSEIGKLALIQGNGPAAFAAFDLALRAKPQHLPALTGKAVALDHMSRHREAQAVYQTALALYPTNFALMSNHALSRAISGDEAYAQSVFTELLNDARHSETTKANLAIVYMLTGKTNEASAILQGMMSQSEINQELKRLSDLRQKRAAGQPIGHLVFQ